MAVDVLVLNTAVVDLRRPDFDFADRLVGKGGLAKCKSKDMPAYPQEQIRQWIDEGFATAGGPGNTAPLIARTGLKVAVGVNLGKGQYDGLDAQGRYFHDVMTANGIDMSATHVHATLPTGTTFIHSTSGPAAEQPPGCGRGGIAYFPNANNDFDFDVFRAAVERLRPRIVYYMYSGLSDRGDANGGSDLADFIRWCRDMGAVTIADSHTLTGDPHKLIAERKPVKEYRLLEPLLPELDLFFTSSDEAHLIENTLSPKPEKTRLDQHAYTVHFLEFLTRHFWQDDDRTKLFGVTVSDGAYEKHILPNGRTECPAKMTSRFMAGEVVDLVGAGDSFRAGLIAYVANNLEAFRKGRMDFHEAVQAGNLFASLYIKAPLGDRYGNMRPYPKMLQVLRARTGLESLEALQQALS
jgi:sugar/nucleoside kinase (ribokinase family)